MSALDFQDREPELDRVVRTNNQFLSGNAAFYERLQGQGRKSAIERFGWIAVPVAAVAIIGIAAATSLPHSSSNDASGPAAQTTASAPAPASIVKPPVNEAQATEQSAQTADASADPSTPRSAIAAPAPVKLARRAPSSDARPASAAPAERAAPTPNAAVTPPPSVPVPSVAPAVQAPAPAVTQDAAPQPAAPAPSTDNSAPQAQPSAPADAQPAQ